MTRWPWITMILAVVVALSPFGRDLVHSSFYSGEQLARSLSQLVLYIGIGIAAALIMIEWLVRWYLARRAKRRPGA